MTVLCPVVPAGHRRTKKVQPPSSVPPGSRLRGSRLQAPRLEDRRLQKDPSLCRTIFVLRIIRFSIKIITLGKAAVSRVSSRSLEAAG